MGSPTTTGPNTCQCRHHRNHFLRSHNYSHDRCMSNKRINSRMCVCWEPACIPSATLVCRVRDSWCTIQWQTHFKRMSVCAAVTFRSLRVTRLHKLDQTASASLSDVKKRTCEKQFLRSSSQVTDAMTETMDPQQRVAQQARWMCSCRYKIKAHPLNSRIAPAVG